jgi:D-amino-acid oxidase
MPYCIHPSNEDDMEALVIGSGVSGLSTGIRLLEAGYNTQIWARNLPPYTTSNVSAALWYPYRAYPEHLVLNWSANTFKSLTELVDEPSTGVLMRTGYEIFPTKVDDPWWKDAVPKFRHSSPDELPAGYADGYTFDVPIISMPLYMQYLLDRFQAHGGVIEIRDLDTLEPALAESPLVVNCAGLGARELVNDRSMVPIRGQVVRVKQNGIERFWLDDYNPKGLCYIIPRIDDIIIGGTDQEHDENLEPDPETAAHILELAYALEPSLRDAEILEHKVGLRPGRPSVRLEAERIGENLVVHNYGHGGAGVTLSWGCADAVVEQIRANGF